MDSSNKGPWGSEGRGRTDGCRGSSTASRRPPATIASDIHPVPSWSLFESRQDARLCQRIDFFYIIRCFYHHGDAAYRMIFLFLSTERDRFLCLRTHTYVCIIHACTYVRTSAIAKNFENFLNRQIDTARLQLNGWPSFLKIRKF